MANEQTQIDRLIADTDVAGVYGIARSCVWNWVDKGLIPKPIVQRHKFTRWSEQEIQDSIRKLRTAERVESAT